MCTFKNKNMHHFIYFFITDLIFVCETKAERIDSIQEKLNLLECFYVLMILDPVLTFTCVNKVVKQLFVWPRPRKLCKLPSSRLYRFDVVCFDNLNAENNTNTAGAGKLKFNPVNTNHLLLVFNRIINRMYFVFPALWEMSVNQPHSPSLLSGSFPGNMLQQTSEKMKSPDAVYTAFSRFVRSHDSHVAWLRLRGQRTDKANYDAKLFLPCSFFCFIISPMTGICCC